MAVRSAQDVRTNDARPVYVVDLSLVHDHDNMVNSFVIKLTSNEDGVSSSL